jgi:hypothetical protein
MTGTSTSTVKAASGAIASVTLEVPAPVAAGAFYRAAFDPDGFAWEAAPRES